MSTYFSKRPIRVPMVLLAFLLGLLPCEAEALSLSLSSLQIEEAIRYGQSTQDLPLAIFAREWRAEGMQGPSQHLAGSARLQSPFALVAHASWAATHRKLSLDEGELERRLKRLRDRLVFVVTLSLNQEPPETYQVSLHQAGEVLQPSHVEIRQDVPEKGVTWVYLYCLFPAEEVDLQGT
ncbi:MAG: hypothetical protein ACE5I9_11495, partial [Candidatus Methylomirabilales bacterium]